MKKKLFLLTLALISSTFFTGCLPTVQLNQRALVQAVGIDWEDNKIKLTMQVFSPNTGGGSNIGASVENAKIIQASGANLTEAMQNATLTQGKKLFIGHNRIIIIGANLAKKGLKQELTYLTTNAEARKNVSVVIAENKASDILKAKINQGILPAEALQKIVDNTMTSGFVENIKLFQFLRALENKHESAILPVISLKKESAKNETSESKNANLDEKTSESKQAEIEEISSISVETMALIKNGKLLRILPKNQSRGVLFIRNAVDTTTILTSNDKFNLAAVNLSEVKTSISTKSTPDEIRIKVIINSSATLGETQINPNTSIILDDIKDVERASEMLIEAECKAAFEQVIQNDKADVLYFGSLVWKENIELWETLRNDWSENISKIKFEVKAHVDIDRFGLEFETTL